jgi:ankyrin repeat protein
MVSSLDLPSQAASGSMQLARQRLAFAYSLRDAAADDALCLDLDVVQQVVKCVLLPNHWTTLMMAAYRGLPDQVLSVVMSGANLHAINNAGRSALDIARALKRQSVVAVLEAHIDA